MQERTAASTSHTAYATANAHALKVLALARALALNMHQHERSTCAPVRAHQLATRRQHWQSERARSQVHYTWNKEQEGNLRRDKRSRLGSTTRQTCTHAALTQSRMQHLGCKTGAERAPPGILLCCACLSAGPTVLAGQQAPSEPSWGPWQPRSFPLEPVPHRSKRGPGLV
jgi:hypothetical protein